MKHLIIGAAGLLLSTSALAAVGNSNKDMAATPTDATVGFAKSAPSLAAVPIGNAILIDHPAKSASETAAPADEAKTFTAGDSKAPIEAAAAESPSTSAMTKSADAELELSASKDMQGMGGPEETDAAATTAVTAAAPQANYRACSPGPGDDNCIQLYEPGVRASYAAWQASHLPGAAQTGMGGPDEDESAAVVPASAESEDLAAYDEPLPEDLVLPASEERLAGNQPSRSNNSTMAI